TGDRAGRRLGPCQRREQNGDKQRDNGNDEQQLDQRESTVTIGSHIGLCCTQRTCEKCAAKQLYHLQAFNRGELTGFCKVPGSRALKGKPQTPAMVALAIRRAKLRTNLRNVFVDILALPCRASLDGATNSICPRRQ